MTGAASEVTTLRRDTNAHIIIIIIIIFYMASFCQLCGCKLFLCLFFIRIMWLCLPIKVYIYLYCIITKCNCNSNVEELIRFPDVKANRQLTYSAKQLIAREVK